MFKAFSLGRLERSKSVLAFIVAFTMVISTLVPTGAMANHDPFGGQVQDKVDICHWAGDHFNSEPQVNVNAIVNGGHGSHTFDIIPPFHYQIGNPNSPVQSFPGLNWSGDNVSLWNQDCVGGGQGGDDTPEVDNCGLENIVVNGSFEDPNVSGWNIFEGDGVAVPGWTAEWMSGSGSENVTPKIEILDGVNGWNGADGTDQFTELDTDWDGPSGSLSGEAASVRISQTLETVPGATYDVSFWTSPRPGQGEDDNETEFVWDGVVQDTIVEDGSAESDAVWTQHSFVLTADDVATVISFADLGDANSLGGFLDEIVVAPRCGDIAGIKFHDVDGDGIQDEGEELLEGWTIYLDVNGNDELDEGEPSTETDENGEFIFESVYTGNYTVREVMQDGWIQTAPGATDYEFNVVVGGEVATDNLAFGNQEGVTVTAHKIVCAEESDLPNWGNGGDDIDENTAADFVADSDGACWMQPDWEFQWAPANASDPSDTFVGELGSPWTTFGPTNSEGEATLFLTADQVEGNPHLWFREVLQDGYMPFSHDSNGNSNANDVSAEAYCHTDVLNYDNWDRIDGVEVGGSYDCVAFNVELPEPDNCDFREQDGWYGRYYNYEETHADMNLDPSLWPDKTHGDPLSDDSAWNTDWYDPQYFVEWDVDSDLEFGPGQFFPLDSLGQDPSGSGHNYHFGVWWTGKVTVPSDGNYGYTLTADDDVWVYVDGELQTPDASGIHAPTTFNGSPFMTAGEHIVDIFFAERHTVQSYMNFSFDDELEVQPWNEDCEPETPTVAADKSGVYDSEDNTITYTINWEVLGVGDLFDAKISDVIPTGTTYVDGSASDGGSLLGNTLWWNLGDLSAGDSGFVTFEVTVDSGEQWADVAGDFDQGLRKDGSAVLPARSIPANALGEEDYVGGPITFVSLGFGGSLVLEFTNYIVDESGDDIEVFEATNGVYPDERIELFVSQTGADGTWVSLGTGTFDSEFDLDDAAAEEYLPWARFVKLVDISDVDLFANDADGYDVDAVRAMHTAPNVCSIENSAVFSGDFEADLEIELDISENELIDIPDIEVTATTTTTVNAIVCDQGNGGNGGDDTCELDITGQVFNDIDGDTFFTEGSDEAGLAGWVIYIDENGNNARDEGEQMTETDAGGFFTLSAVGAPGTYIVRQETPEGWTLTFPEASDEGEYEVDLVCPEPEVDAVQILARLFVQALPSNGTDLRFANQQVDDSSTNGDGGSGGSSSGSGGNNDDNGEVAGDQIIDPNTGQVLGDVLPATGMAAGYLMVMIALGFGVWLLMPRKKSEQK